MLRAAPELVKLDKPASSGPKISQIPKIRFRFSSRISVSEMQLPDLISESLPIFTFQPAASVFLDAALKTESKNTDSHN